MFSIQRLSPILFSMAFTLMVLLSSVALADVPIRGEVCNLSKIPVSVEFFHHNTIGDIGGPFTTATVQPCSCITKNTHSDLWHNPPFIKVKQLAFVEIEGDSSTERKVCLKASSTSKTKAGVELPIKKTVKGYAEYERDAEVSGDVCSGQSSNVRWSSTAPQIDYAQSSYRVLASRQTHSGKECSAYETALFGGRGNCKSYNVLWLFDDGTGCYNS